MLHWTPRAGVTVAPVTLIDPPTMAPAVSPHASMRGDHARMLAYAALRRRRAVGTDGAYWKACAPAAVAKAAAIRGDRGFPSLP